jgi:hypothetical protein
LSPPDAGIGSGRMRGKREPLEAAVKQRSRSVNTVDTVDTVYTVYRAQQFAKLAGVTVRALHHYDRLGVLKPSGRSDAGYRLYRDRDFARLEQIVVLKFLGLPLRQIGRLLKRESPLADALQRQQVVLA